MQKRPKQPFSYAKIELDGEFPAAAGPLYEQRDRAITSLHFHDYHEIGICIDGAGIFVVEGKVLPFKEGDAIFIARDERHLAQSLPGTASHWHWLYFDFERLLCPAFTDTSLADMSQLSGPGFANVVSRDSHPKICALVRSLLEACQGSSPLRREEIVALLALFSIEMRRSFLKGALNGRSPASAGSADPDRLGRLGKALEQMARRHGGQFRLSSLAKLCGMSQTHFRRLFQQTLGKSPREYLQQLRIATAMAELDRSARPVSEIALSCGYSTISSFNRQFKESAGVSPRQWRRRNI